MELLRNRPRCSAESGGAAPSVPTVQRLCLRRPGTDTGRLSTTELSRAAWSCSLPLTAISDCQPACAGFGCHISDCQLVCGLWQSHLTVSLCAGFGCHISDCQPVCGLWQSHQWLSACVRALAVTSVTVSLCAGLDYAHFACRFWLSRTLRLSMCFVVHVCS